MQEVEHNNMLQLGAMCRLFAKMCVRTLFYNLYVGDESNKG